MQRRSRYAAGRGARLPGNAPASRTAGVRPHLLRTVMHIGGGKQDELASHEYASLPFCSL